MELPPPFAGGGSSPRARGTRTRRPRARRQVRFIPACAGNAATSARTAASLAVHPRVRGERFSRTTSVTIVIGASPRARGTRRVEHADRALRRFIPACAGNAARARSSAAWRPVHPRVRGERAGTAVARRHGAGSSPRARGTRLAARCVGDDRRFIPACAGNAPGRPPIVAVAAVHPRVRGERRGVAEETVLADGSSPRARGTREPHRLELDARRFIPACAGNAAAPSTRRVARSVHPRVRGERTRGGQRAAAARGSSPRARGTPLAELGPDPRRRFIPACAGNAALRATTTGWQAVHPRVRGERSVRPPSATSQIGSSPRARGTPVPRLVRGAPCRFIPACAGNASRHHCFRSRVPVHPRVRGERPSLVMSTCCVAGSSPRARGTPRAPMPHRRSATVHPRVRGERNASLHAVFIVSGSSPRARGTPAAAPHDRIRGRFIPACAGNAGRRRSRARVPAVHPRVRGERSGSRIVSPLHHGSSPRARGTPLEREHLAPRARFIPACAGNARATTAATASCAVHPRVRGERPKSSTATALFDGSSPRARGTPRRHAPRVHRRRFIPACAGNAAARSSSRACMAVHPRVRGERMTRRAAALLRLGSSPRARGTLGQVALVLRDARFIPACAGNALSLPSTNRMCAVHPRVRGERGAKATMLRANGGSSPRARGTLVGAPGGVRRTRFIPACAGNASVHSR